MGNNISIIKAKDLSDRYNYTLDDLKKIEEYTTGKSSYGRLSIEIPKVRGGLVNFIERLLYRVENTERPSVVRLGDTDPIGEDETYPRGEAGEPKGKYYARELGGRYTTPILYRVGATTDSGVTKNTTYDTHLADTGMNKSHTEYLYYLTTYQRAYIQVYLMNKYLKTKSYGERLEVREQLLSNAYQFNEMMEEVKRVIDLIKTDTYINVRMFNRLYKEVKQLEEVLNTLEINIYEFYELSITMEGSRVYIYGKVYPEEELRDEIESGRIPIYTYGEYSDGIVLPPEPPKEEEAYVYTRIIIEDRSQLELQTMSTQSTVNGDNAPFYVTKGVSEKLIEELEQSNVRKLKEFREENYDKTYYGYMTERGYYRTIREENVYGRAEDTEEVRYSLRELVVEHTLPRLNLLEQEVKDDLSKDYNFKYEVIHVNLQELENNVNHVSILVNENGKYTLIPEGIFIEDFTTEEVDKLQKKLQRVHGGQQLFNVLNMLVTEGGTLNYTNTVTDLNRNKTTTLFNVTDKEIGNESMEDVVETGKEDTEDTDTVYGLGERELTLINYYKGIKRLYRGG